MKTGLLPALVLAPAALVMACGSDGPDNGSETSGEIERQIAGVAELAADAYAAAGPEALYDYLSPETAARCPRAALASALAADPVPDGFRRVENVRVERHVVRATVVLVYGDREEGVEWQFWTVPAASRGATPRKEDPQVWRLVYVPGLERCGS